MGEPLVRNKTFRLLEYDYEQEGETYLIGCGMEHCDPGVVCADYARKGYHLHAVLSGKGTLYADGKEFHPHLGQLFVIKEDEEITYISDPQDPWHYCWVVYAGEQARQITEEMGFTKGIYCLDSSIDTGRFFQLVSRMQETTEMSHIYDLRRRGILLEYISLAMEATTKGGRRCEHPLKEYIDSAIRFIHNNYAEITVNDIVKYSGFTRSYFSTVFHRHTGLSINDYLRQYRLKQICDQIRTSDLPIAQIAARNGYEDPVVFSRMFRNAYGISPREYRKRYMN